VVAAPCHASAALVMMLLLLLLLVTWKNTALLRERLLLQPA
jgi:putative intracellular protease/amidase